MDSGFGVVVPLSSPMVAPMRWVRARHGRRLVYIARYPLRERWQQCSLSCCLECRSLDKLERLPLMYIEL